MGCKDQETQYCFWAEYSQKVSQAGTQAYDEDELDKKANETHYNKSYRCPDGDLVELCVINRKRQVRGCQGRPLLLSHLHAFNTHLFGQASYTS